MWFEYLSERLGYSVIEKQHGFIVYQIVGDDCFIHDLYVKPDYRRINLGSELADEVQRLAKESGCKRIWGQIVVGSGGDSEAMIAHLKWGLRLDSVRDNSIFTVKEI
jgi:GNAT superfamily N-acetyltransferase